LLWQNGSSNTVTPAKEKSHAKSQPSTDRERRVAVITGGSRGIGLALAKVFAASGYTVFITSREQGRLDRAVNELEGSGGTVSGVVCDVADAASVSKAFHRIRQQHKTIDVLINNAGMAHDLDPVEKLPIEAWRQVIDTNLTGTFLVTQVALPLMSAGSTIVNNLSIAATQPFEGMSAYNASKFGALGFTKVLREEVRKRGIRVLALLPGATNTDIWQQFWPDAPRDKMISPDTVAQAVLHAVAAPTEASVEEIIIGPTAGVL
jgi:NAD(P)-dependent dehydrogenase (short-subunit alcohol dehydrogenase family)